MTEQEWLSSDDPAAMLAAIRYRPETTDGRLRAWAKACRTAFAVSNGGTPDDPWPWNDLDGQPDMLEHAVAVWSSKRPRDSHGVPMADRAALLREVLGNPFRPVKLPFVHDGGRQVEGFAVSGRAVRRMKDSPHLYEAADHCPWLTPAVLSLARLARDNLVRPLLAPGQRYRSQVVAERNTVVGCCNAHADSQGCDCLARAVSDVPCIDPFRLAVLADALEEAGCDSADLLGHLRSDGPHIGACWALALILGED